jgi:hypothetical protein
MEPGFHCVRKHWIRGFIAFERAGAFGSGALGSGEGEGGLVGFGQASELRR